MFIICFYSYVFILIFRNYVTYQDIPMACKQLKGDDMDFAIQNNSKQYKEFLDEVKIMT